MSQVLVGPSTTEISGQDSAELITQGNLRSVVLPAQLGVACECLSFGLGPRAQHHRAGYTAKLQ